MKLVTNVTPLLTPLTGIGHYTRQLLIELAKREEVADIRGVSTLRWYEQHDVDELLSTGYSDEDVAVRARQKFLSQKAKQQLLSLAKKIPYARRVKHRLEQRTARRRSLAHGDYVYWEPNYTLLPLDNPAVVTVHDLSHVHFPDYHPVERVKLLAEQLEKSVLSAKRVVAVSEYTKIDIVKTFGLPADKIDIVSPAVCDSFRKQFSSQQYQQVKAHYQLPDNYVLSVATLEPRKNIEGLISAFSQLPKQLRQTFPLVLVGVKGWLSESLEKKLQPLLNRGEAFRLGYVEQAHLPAIYSAATCLAYVSFFEGYGMPVAEAMAAGTAVITSDTSSMPEVAAGSALLVDPYQHESIAAALKMMLDDVSLRNDLVVKARAISDDYRWEHSASSLLKVLQSV